MNISNIGTVHYFNEIDGLMTFAATVGCTTMTTKGSCLVFDPYLGQLIRLQLQTDYSETVFAGS